MKLRLPKFRVVAYSRNLSEDVICCGPQDEDVLCCGPQDEVFYFVGKVDDTSLMM